ncbi:PREDICTED: uncharacterized protein LOC105448372 [Wasmannia auropunctata]|uniref:uncharacterized protein LOC105448372 n=1 Tax=Wasmannia auropunctata TaxID=64793 RepID=UPI0005EF7B18|nr:PREDICTED: uncharacterized protein LOC105448372 [Wasmannia auropunctata]
MRKRTRVRTAEADHQLLVATLRINLKKMRKPEVTPNLMRVDVDGFRRDIEHELEKVSQRGDKRSNSLWEALKEAMTHTAKQNMLPRVSRKNFITPGTDDVILKRRELKRKGLSSENEHEQYSRLNREVQRRCRSDKNAYINDICAELERHSVKGEIKSLFCKVRELTRQRSPRTWVIEDDSGRAISEVEEILERWRLM